MFSGACGYIFSQAKTLRKQQTFAEEILWHYLRTKPYGFKFRRQHPYSIYVLDFYCYSLKLVIEVDGSIHNLEEVKQKDKSRQKQLESEGLIFLRILNEEIIKTPEKVIRKIENFIKEKIESRKVSST